MIYSELPKWAQRKVKQWAKKEFLRDADELRQSGENVPYYSDEELEHVTMVYLNSKDDFEIEYDEETGEQSIFY